MAKLTDTIILGDLTVTGTTRFKNDVTLETEINSNFIPDTDGSYSLGTASLRFSTLYAQGIDVEGQITSIDTDTSNVFTLGNTTNASAVQITASGNDYQLSVNGSVEYTISGNSHFIEDSPLYLRKPGLDVMGLTAYDDGANGTIIMTRDSATWDDSVRVTETVVQLFSGGKQATWNGDTFQLNGIAPALVLHEDDVADATDAFRIIKSGGHTYFQEEGNDIRFTGYNAVDLPGDFQVRTGGAYHDIWHAGNDGAGSGLDADLLDGLNSTQFLRSDTSDTLTGLLTVSNTTGSTSLMNMGGASNSDYGLKIEATELNFEGDHSKTGSGGGMLHLYHSGGGITSGGDYIVARSGATTHFYVDGSGDGFFAGDVIVGATSGATNNPNTWIANAADTYSQILFRTGGTTNAKIISNVTNGSMLFDASAGFTWRDGPDGNNIATLNTSGVLSITGSNFNIGDGSAGNSIAMLASTTGSNNILMGDTGNAQSGRIQYDNSTNQFNWTAGGTNRMSLNGSGLALESGSRVSSILDEDTMSSNSATALATQQSIKAYVDSAVSGGTGDAGTLDGLDSSQFLRSDQDDSMNGLLTVNATNGDGVHILDSSNSSASPALLVRGNRSDTNTSQSFSGKMVLQGLYTSSAVTSGKRLGTIFFGGNHTNGSSSNISHAASISAVAEGTFNSVNDMPTALVFYTGDSGIGYDTANATAGTETFRIGSDGMLTSTTSISGAQFKLLGAGSTDGVYHGFFSGDYYIVNQDNEKIIFGTNNSTRGWIAEDGALVWGNGLTSTIAGATWENGWVKIGTSGAGWSFDSNEMYNAAAGIIGTLSGTLQLNAATELDIASDTHITGNVAIGNSVQSARALYAYKLGSSATDTDEYANYSYILTTGTPAMTADRSKFGLYGRSSLADTSTTGDSNVAALNGVFGYASITSGHSDNMYGIQGLAQVDGGADSNAANAYGANLEARLNNTGSTITTMMGSMSRLRTTSDADTAVTTGYGVRSLLDHDGPATFSTVYLYQGFVDIEASTGTISTLYGMHLNLRDSMGGTVTNTRGIWVEAGDTLNSVYNNIQGVTVFGGNSGSFQSVTDTANTVEVQGMLEVYATGTHGHSVKIGPWGGDQNNQYAGLLADNGNYLIMHGEDSDQNTYISTRGTSANVYIRPNANETSNLQMVVSSSYVHIDDNKATGAGLLVTGGGAGGYLARFERDVGSAGAIDINCSNGDPTISFDNGSTGTKDWSIGATSASVLAISEDSSPSSDPMLEFIASSGTSLRNNNWHYFKDTGGSNNMNIGSSGNSMYLQNYVAGGNINVQLAGSNSTGSFLVYDSSGTPLFQIASEHGRQYNYSSGASATFYDYYYNNDQHANGTTTHATYYGSRSSDGNYEWVASRQWVGVINTAGSEQSYVRDYIMNNGALMEAVRQTYNYTQINTESGYVQIGPQNTGFCHFSTDRNQFYFNKSVEVDGIFYLYDNNLNFWDVGDLQVSSATGTTEIRAESTGAYRARLSAHGGGSGYTTADILLEDDSGQTTRGMGMYAYNRASGEEWFIGQPYNGDENDFAICHANQSNGSEGQATANISNAELRIDAGTQYLYLGGSKEAIRYGDAWLRLNNSGSFTSGIYCGSSTVRTDGTLQVGSGGAHFSASSSAITCGVEVDMTAGFELGDSSTYQTQMFSTTQAVSLTRWIRLGQISPGVNTLKINNFGNSGYQGEIVEFNMTYYNGAGAGGEHQGVTITSRQTHTSGSEFVEYVADYVSATAADIYVKYVTGAFGGTQTLEWNWSGQSTGGFLGYTASSATSAPASAIANNGLFLRNGTIQWEGNTVWHAGNDGSGSGLDADLLDGQHASTFLRSDTADAKTSGTLTFNDNVICSFGTSNDMEFFHNGTSNYIDLNNGSLFIRESTTTRFTFARTTGDFTATGNVTAYSDARLKNIRNVTNRSSLFDNLIVYDFDWKDGRGSSIGPLAQDVQKDAPELVVEDEDGNLSLDYGKYAVAALHESKKRINELEDKVERLEALLNKLLESK